MDVFQRCREKVQGKSATVVFPESSDSRILNAARRITDESIAKVILLGKATELTRLAHESNLDLADFQVLDPSTSNRKTDYAERYVLNRPRTRPAVAARIVTKPLYFGATMVRAGHADLMVAGIGHATRRVIEAAASCIGLRDDTSVASSLFVMTFADRPPLVFADCAVNVDPTAAELADIAITTATNAQRLLEVPAKVALLSFSTKGSAGHARVDKVTQTLQIAREKAPDLLIDGELQADAALVASVAAEKTGDGGLLAGEANVLIFPDLDAANIGYKLVQHLAHAQAIGPILQGFALPVADLSRGASINDIVSTTVMALALKE